MTGRRSKGVNFFCWPYELDSILEPVLTQFGLVVCVAEKINDLWFFHKVDSLVRNAVSLPKFYLFPSLVPKDGLISLANIMQIWFPQNLDKAISMGEIGMLVADSNLDNKSVELQREIYLVLRKQLRMRFMKGVWGRNSKTGRDNFYKNILISETVRDAASRGLILKNMLADGYVTFSPEHIQ